MLTELKKNEESYKENSVRWHNDDDTFFVAFLFVIMMIARVINDEGRPCRRCHSKRVILYTYYIHKTYIHAYVYYQHISWLFCLNVWNFKLNWRFRVNRTRDLCYLNVVITSRHGWVNIGRRGKFYSNKVIFESSYPHFLIFHIVRLMLFNL